MTSNAPLDCESDHFVTYVCYALDEESPELHLSDIRNRKIPVFGEKKKKKNF